MNNPILTIDERNNIDAGPWFSTLSEELRAAILSRAEVLLAGRSHPYPPEDWPAVPWPPF